MQILAKKKEVKEKQANVSTIYMTWIIRSLKHMRKPIIDANAVDIKHSNKLNIDSKYSTECKYRCFFKKLKHITTKK